MRTPDLDDRQAIRGVQEMAFGYTLPDGVVSPWVEAVLEPHGHVADFDGAIVGCSGAFDAELTLPGCQSIECVGVTSVAVKPTHRRRGALTALTDAQLEGLRSAGVGLAALIASEATIYERFGYGCASRRVEIEVDTRRAELRVAKTSGALRHVDTETAATIYPEVHERRRRSTPGMMRRPQIMWDHFFRDHDSVRGGASGLFHVVRYDDHGAPAGYVSYRIAENWTPRGPSNTAIATMMCGIDRAADLELWRFLISLDLVTTVRARSSVDTPLIHALTDRRAVTTTEVSDDLWLRIVDLPKTLEQRRYSTSGRLVIGCVDWQLSTNTGHFELLVEDGRAHVRRSTSAPVASADIASWSALLLGDVSATALLDAGRLQGDPDAVDRIFGVPTSPFNDVAF